MSSQYDKWATGGRYRRIAETAYCHNHDCPEYGEPQLVLYESEYGAGWLTPEECPDCHEPWADEWDSPPPGVDVVLT